jgi:hypothetical protein
MVFSPEIRKTKHLTMAVDAISETEILHLIFSNKTLTLVEIVSLVYLLPIKVESHIVLTIHKLTYQHCSIILLSLEDQLTMMETVVSSVSTIPSL